MLKNHMLVAIRSLLRNKAASLIKIISLSVGMICFAVISLFVFHELSYDRFHDDPDRVYRVVKDFVNEDGSSLPDATTPPALAPALWRDLPEVQSATRVFPNWGRKYLLEVGDIKFYEENLIRIDSSFFDVFSFPFVKGNKSTAFANNDFILLTESAAKRLFGEEDAMGKTVHIDVGDADGSDFQVTAILKDVPDNSHFTFDFLISVRSFNYRSLDTDWNWYNYYTYARLKPGASAGSFISKLQPLYKKYNPESENQYYAQQLGDIHLKSNLKWELSANGDESYIQILSMIAIFIVLLAVINYVNLVTAQSAKRAKEVGVRKVSGAAQGLLIRQFLIESILLALMATIISIAIAEAILPFFQDLFSTSLSFFNRNNLVVLWSLIGVGLATGLFAGLYPSMYLSRFNPVNVLKGTLSPSHGGSFVRQGLVIFQFVISSALIVGAVVITEQIDFIRKKDLGFEKNNVLIINNAGNLSNIDALLNELKKVSGVDNIGAANGTLGGQNWTTISRAKDQQAELLMNFLLVDYDFLEVMNVGFVEGRNYSQEFGADSSAIIINETAARQLGLTEPYVGSQVSMNEDSDGNPIYSDVIGVTRDFHFTSFHEDIKPFAFALYKSAVDKLFVKINSDNLAGTVSSIENKWTELVPNRPFDFSFQDEQVAKLYINELKFRKLFSYFTIVAIVIACLGLFGLSAYTTQLRTKEIGIRKVLGASVVNVTGLLSKDFLKLVVIAIVISTPLAWFLMNRWLETFAYRIEISVWVFLLSGISAIIIALLTVSFQSIKAAIANPVNSLRNE